MKCMACGQEVKETVQDYVYSASGLPYVILHGVTIATCPCGEDEVEIPRIAQLHKTIAFMVAKKEDRLTPEEVRFLRKYLGLSGEDLGKRMDVRGSQVSRWENGHETMSFMAERLLRLMALNEAPRDSYSLEFLDHIGTATKPAKVELADRGSRGWQPAECVPA